MIDFLCNIILWAVSFIMYVMNNHFWKLCRKRCLKTSSNSFYVDFVFILFKLRIVLFYILPSIARFLCQWESDYMDHVMPYEVCIVYIAELLSMFIYDSTLLYLLRKNQQDLSFNKKNSRTVKIFAIALMSLYVYFSITSIMSEVDNNPGTDDLWMIRPLTIIVGSATCYYILPMGRKYWNSGVMVYALVVLLISLVISFASGIRGKVFWPVLWMLYCAVYFSRDKLLSRAEIQKKIRKWLVVCGMLLGLLAVVQGGMTAARSDKTNDVAESLNEINSQKNDASRSFLNEVGVRFGAATHFSVGFFRMYSKGESAGLNPIINSMYSPIPRRFMPDKPVPCSVDGDEYGTGMYKTYAEIIPGSYSMTEFSTAAHAYWELGLLGIILFSVIPAVYVFLSIKLFRQFDLLGPCFFLAIFKPWGYNEPKMWVSDIILQLSQIILVSLFFLLIFNKLKRILN